MVTQIKAKKPKAVWTKHCHDYLDSDMYETSFPSLYGTGISISTFSPKKILTIGEVLKDSLEYHSLLRCEDHANNRRIYVFLGSEADTKLSLNCCFEGDCFDWDANSAFFKEGKLVAIVSMMASEEDKLPQSQYDLGDKDKDLIKIYKNEIRRIARTKLSYKGEGDPYKEFISILKAESPPGQGLHDSYRESIRSILRNTTSD